MGLGRVLRPDALPDVNPPVFAAGLVTIQSEVGQSRAEFGGMPKKRWQGCVNLDIETLGVRHVGHASSMPGIKESW